MWAFLSRLAVLTDPVHPNTVTGIVAAVQGSANGSACFEALKLTPAGVPDKTFGSGGFAVLASVGGGTDEGMERVNADGTRTQVTLADAGNANPGNLFRYDAALGGYVFNLSTKGLTAGTYDFVWTAEGDPTDHHLGFALI